RYPCLAGHDLPLKMHPARDDHALDICRVASVHEGDLAFGTKQAFQMDRAVPVVTGAEAVVNHQEIKAFLARRQAAPRPRGRERIARSPGVEARCRPGVVDVLLAEDFLKAVPEALRHVVFVVGGEEEDFHASPTFWSTRLARAAVVCSWSARLQSRARIPS